MSRVIIVARISRLPWRRSLEHRASCVAVATRTSTGVACSPALEVPPPRSFGDAVACPHKGLAADRGTSATTRRGNGVATTGLGTAATAQGRYCSSPSRSRAATAGLGTTATAQGRCRRSLSGSGAATADLGTAATACRGWEAAATAARTIGQPPSLMNRDGAWKTDP
jgi:hypothetical protein